MNILLALKTDAFHCCPGQSYLLRSPLKSIILEGYNFVLDCMDKTFYLSLPQFSGTAVIGPRPTPFLTSALKCLKCTVSAQSLHLHSSWNNNRNNLSFFEKESILLWAILDPITDSRHHMVASHVAKNKQIKTEPSTAEDFYRKQCIAFFCFPLKIFFR